MTQSGQGEEPSARPAHEGIVLPSDGGEPLLPGMSAAPAPAAPAGGQAWGGPWGPGQQSPQPQPGQGWPPAAAQQWTQPEPPPTTGPGPLPPEGAPAPQYDSQPYAAGPPYGTAAPGHELPTGNGTGPQPYGTGGDQQPYGTPAPGHELPAGAAAGPQHYGSGGHQQQHGGAGHELPPAAGGPQGYGAGGEAPPYGGGAPQAQPSYGAPDPYQQQYGTQAGAGAQGAPPAPAAAGNEAATQYLPPVPPVQAGPAVHAADEGATQYLPPVPAGFTPMSGPGPAPADEGATQYIPPVAPGAMPPESAGNPNPYPGQGAPQQPGAGPAHPDSQATQYIPPVGAGTQQPPAGFENLFRSEPGGPGLGEGPAGATQQLPVQPAAGYPGAGPAQVPYRPVNEDDDGDAGGRRGGRTGSRVPLIAAIGVAIAVLGIGAGAMLSGGGGDKQSDDNKPVADSSPTAAQNSASPAADPGKQQAIALDKLLADSGSSRASVIKAVADVKGCDNLSQASSDLRDAATQRGDLVTRLGKLSVDKLPDHAALTTALTKAWRASAAADNHYAAWAKQVGGKKGCHKGHARPTGQTQAGNRESGVASGQKVKASALWNTIAKKYGLTERQPTQL
ncbi:hypothetical protein [Streptomyces sp. NPDC047028]|uniref:hypothetical protein n=1 Tax=Streptomyces sp. NPDC047028 TaxID=3155793 RepID=UPI0033F21BAC